MRSRRIFRRARVEASARSRVLAVDASEDAVERFLDGLKYDDKGLVAAIAQDACGREEDSARGYEDLFKLKVR